MNEVFPKAPVSALRVTIEHALHDLPIGETLQWEDLENKCNVPRNGLYAAVRAARSRLLRVGKKYRVVTDVGVMRISENDAAEFEVERGRQRVLRSAKGLGRYTESVDITQVTDTNKVRVLGAGMLASFIARAAEPKTVHALGAGADPKKLLAESLEAMKR